MKKTLIFALAIFNIAASLPWMKDVEDGGDIEIVDGHEIDISKVPYQVYLNINKKYMCGGSIINKNFILTAAHCIMNGIIMIRAGSSNWSNGGVVVKVANMTTHPKYVDGQYDFDIAVLQLEKPLEFTDKIRPAKLADKSYVVPDGDIMLVTGWGKTWTGRPEKLLGVELPQLNFNKCAVLMKELLLVTLTRNFICALHPNQGHNACQGDSGGPLTHKGTQVGVVSYGGPCNNRAAPVAYSSVAVFRDWIESIAGKV